MFIEVDFLLNNIEVVLVAVTISSPSGCLTDCGLHCRRRMSWSCLSVVVVVVVVGKVVVVVVRGVGGGVGVVEVNSRCGFPCTDMSHTQRGHVSHLRELPRTSGGRQLFSITST